MFGKKPQFEEGTCVFSTRRDGEFSKIIFGIVTGVDGSKIGVNGLIIDPVGLKNKVSQGKAGPRSREILENTTSKNCIFSLIYRVEQDNFTQVLDTDSDKIEIIPPKVYNVLDGWIRESIPELINNILSLSPGSDRDQAKRVLRNRMDTLIDKNLKRNLYSVCRSLKILN